METKKPQALCELLPFPCVLPDTSHQGPNILREWREAWAGPDFLSFNLCSGVGGSHFTQQELKSHLVLQQD